MEEFFSTASPTTIFHQNFIRLSFIIIVIQISSFSVTFLRKVERDRGSSESTKRSDDAAKEESESDGDSELSGEDVNYSLGSQDNAP